MIERERERERERKRKKEGCAILAGHDRTPQGMDFAVRTNVAMITTMMTTATHRTEFV